MATSLTYEMPHLEVEEFPRVETVITTVTEVIREELPKIDTVATVELQRRDKFRGSEFCLQFWLALETFFWLSLFIVEVRYQFIFMRNDHLLDFINETDGYFYLFFGEELRYADQKVRTNILFFNLCFMMLCVIYVIFCCILIFGISKCKKSCFLPYIILDIIMMALAVLGALIGMATNNHHLFRVSFVFLIVKLYVEFCVISLYREYKLKKKIKNQHNGASSFDPSEGDQITAV